MKGYIVVSIPTVLKYSTPQAANLSAISLVVMTAATGCPLPIGLPKVTMSGQTPVTYVVIGCFDNVISISILVTHTLKFKCPEVFAHTPKSCLYFICYTEASSCVDVAAHKKEKSLC